MTSSVRVAPLDPDLSGSGLTAFAASPLPVDMSDSVPSEDLGNVKRTQGRTMPWAPAGQFLPNAPVEDLVADRVVSLVTEVNEQIVTSPDVIEVQKPEPLKPSAVGAAQNRHWAALSAAWNAEQVEAAGEQDASTPNAVSKARRRGVLAFLRGSQAIVEDEDLTPDQARDFTKQAFAERVKRIQRGKQWQPDGVLDAVGRNSGRSKMPLGQRPNFRFAVFITCLTALTALAVGPDKIQGYTEQALALVPQGTWAAVAGESQVAASILGR